MSAFGVISVSLALPTSVSKSPHSSIANAGLLVVLKYQ